MILKTTLRYYFFLCNFKFYLTKSKNSYILLINLTRGRKEWLKTKERGERVMDKLPSNQLFSKSEGALHKGFFENVVIFARKFVFMS